MPVLLHLGLVEITVDDAEHLLVTTFEDGSHVDARPNFDAHSLALAYELGYHGDTWAMSRDHEIMHSWLAFDGHHDALGRPGWRSATLVWLAHGVPIVGCRAHLVRWEESRVLAAQAALDKTVPRPWERPPYLLNAEEVPCPAL